MDPPIPVILTPPRPSVAISAGDPLGIGPEITVKALARPDVRSLARFTVFAIDRTLRDAARLAGIKPFWTTVAHGAPLPSPLPDILVRDYPECDTLPSAPCSNAAAGAASFRFIEDAIAACKFPPAGPAHADAIVTAPISKTAWELAGLRDFPGHTELLADRFGAARSAMLFVGPTLRVILVTIHVPLARVPSLISTQGVLNAIELGEQACRELGVASPRVGVCGLNPHAGEGGILGHEDGAVIAPAVKLARSRRIDAVGPLPADALFPAAAAGGYDLVVAMYHDQGLTPIKLLARDRTINVTVGLPGVVRTSPAHGTAFDIAGRNLARPDSMIAAIQLAVQLASRRATRQ